MTKRDAINLFRKELNERGVDSTYTDKDLYLALVKQANWLIKREVSAGRIYRNTSFFQKLRGREVTPVDTVPACLSVKTGCKIYRTKNPLPELWQENDGPIIKRVSSIDDSISFTLTTATTWEDIQKDPYQQYDDTMYCFPAEGHLWFPKHNPHKVNTLGFFKDDIRLVKVECEECDSTKDGDCIRFLDTKFMVPDWVEAELFAKALQLMMPSKSSPEDSQPDKNTNRKN